MWVNVMDKPIPTYGMDGKSFFLRLCYSKYYGHNVSKDCEIVTAIWDSLNECFYESDTMTEIDDRDIVQWWKSV